MSTQRFEFSDIKKLLRLSENDQMVRSFFGSGMSSIARYEYYGSLEFKLDGVDVVFVEAPWILTPDEITNSKTLYLSAFHLHREGHEGYAGYSGHLPNGVSFGDTEIELIHKMGPPTVTGGGGKSEVFKKIIPRWLRYSIERNEFHLQLDASGRLEMATLSSAEVQPVSR